MIGLEDYITPADQQVATHQHFLQHPPRFSDYIIPTALQFLSLQSVPAGETEAMASMAKTGFLLMLLLAAVVATQAHKCTCKNSTPTILTVNGELLDVGAEIDLDLLDLVDVDITIVAFDKFGKKVEGKCHVPSYVTGLEFLYVAVDKILVVKVTGVDSLLGGLLDFIGDLLAKIGLSL